MTTRASTQTAAKPAEAGGRLPEQLSTGAVDCGGKEGDQGVTPLFNFRFFYGAGIPASPCQQVLDKGPRKTY